MTEKSEKPTGPWRIFEAVGFPGWWGILDAEAGDDADPILYPQKICREYVENIIDAHNAAIAKQEGKVWRREKWLESSKGERDALRAAVRGLLAHSGIADAGADMKDAEDHAAESKARAALNFNSATYQKTVV